MKLLLKILKSIFCISILILVSCDPANKEIQANKEEANAGLEELAFTVEEAPEWSALFNRTSGWFGADGAYSIPLDGKDNINARAARKTILLFSNTLIGKISNGRLSSDLNIINNSAAYLTGSKPEEEAIHFYWDENEEGKLKPLFVPNTSSAQKEDYYWMGDGFVNTARDNDIYIFGSRMRNINEGEWGFSPMGTALIVLPSGSRPPFKDQRQVEIPFFFEASSPNEKGSFGAGIFVNTKKADAPEPDGYLYIYGVKGKNKELMVARVRPKDIETFSAWRFWDGEEWTADMQQVTDVTQNVSNELSVSALPDGRYALIFTLNGLESPTVGLRLGQTPYGPFGPVIEVYEAREMQQENYVTYNAKAHPNLSAPGELLISYNVNAFDFFNEIKMNPNLYRPRFIRVKLQ